jgi:hypothetical protein
MALVNYLNFDLIGLSMNMIFLIDFYYYYYWIVKMIVGLVGIGRVVGLAGVAGSWEGV